ncbi:MAG: hypothetical protein HY880_05675 [Deltaproteobacteria bacterium]|nr:hypothetical protein [Deltaproteobacteria bacterium]
MEAIVIKDGFGARQQFVVDTAGIFKLYIYENNLKLQPTSAMLTVYKPGSTEKLIDAQTMDVAADGLLSYALSASHNDIAGENYKAVVSYVVGATTYVQTLFYDVVGSRLAIVITDNDLFAELPQLKDSNWRVHGTADSGSTTTIVDAELKRYPDDYFMGGLAYSLDEVRDITDFVSSTGTITTTAFSSAIATDKYILTRSFAKEIQRAFEKIEARISQMGRRTHLVLDPYDLREAHIYETVAGISKGLSLDNEGFWWSIWKDYEKKADAIFKDMDFKYDLTEDGIITGQEAGEGRKGIRAART